MRKQVKAMQMLFLVMPLILHFNVATGKPIPDAIRAGFEAISARRIQAHLSFLASKELQGREAGTHGGRITAQYLESQFQLDGLTPVPNTTSMLQKFDITKIRVNIASNIRITHDTETTAFPVHESFFVISKNDRDMLLSAPVLFAGFGVKNDDGYNDYTGLNADGKIVLVYDGKPGELTLSGSIISREASELRTQKAELAATLGARALLFLNSNAELGFNQRTLTRVYRKPKYKITGDPEQLPQVIITEAIASPLFRMAGWQIDSLEHALLTGTNPLSFEIPFNTVALNLQMDCDTVETQNVVAYIQGSDPILHNEVVAYSAHFDHEGIKDGKIYHGADDNGSGTAALLELAHAYMNNPVKPRRSIMFIAHTAEEKGLLGSKYAAEHSGVSLSSVQALLNIDMIGRNDENEVYIIGSDFLSYELHDINTRANQAIGMELDYRYNRLSDPNRFYYRSDHYTYARHDVPIIFYFTGTHEDYHQPTDTVDKINFQKITRICRLAFLTGWQVANLDHRLKLDGLLKQE
jgi:hypothetical protein